MGNFEKLGVLVIIILAVVIMIVLIGGGPQEALEPEEGDERVELNVPTNRPGSGGNPGVTPPNVLNPEPDIVVPPEPDWPPAPIANPNPGPNEPGGNTVRVTPPVDPDPVVEDLFHVVKKNENLYRIALQYFGHGKYFKEILSANPGVSAANLTVGQKLRIPHPETVLSGGGASPAAIPPANQSLYTVKKGDSLWRIAKEQLGRGTAYTKIRDANLDVLGPNGTDLSVGMKLRIPR